MKVAADLSDESFSVCSTEAVGWGEISEATTGAAEGAGAETEGGHLEARATEKALFHEGSP